MSRKPSDEAARHGRLAGAIGGLLTAILLTAAQLWLGVPIPPAFVADLFLPLLPVGLFVGLIGLVGGFLISKYLALVSFFLVQAIGGAVLGMMFAKLVERLRARHGAGAFRRATLILAAVLLAVWAVTVGVFSSVLTANYRGTSPGQALAVAALTLLLAVVVYGVALVRVFATLETEAPRQEPSGPAYERRTFLAGAATAGIALATAGLGAYLWRRSALLYDGQAVLGPKVEPITPNDRFYVVTKNIVDPDVAAGEWILTVDGLVERPRTYSLEDLRALDRTEQETTLECISNSVGGGLLSNARWTGIPLRSLLEASGPTSDAGWIFATGVDGYGHALPLEHALRRTTFLAYEMNGEPLPDRHGFPARLVVPGVYGEGSVKWVRQIELTAGEKKGLYERQGWEPFFVHTTSRIDQPEDGQSLRPARTTVRGVAFAGDRGISRVEVSTDGGRTWAQATIDYSPSEITWVLWSFPWQPSRAGDHELVVRATDGTGALQTTKVDDSVPDGATGYHRVKTTVRA